jgi:hypothetical protein
MDVQNRIELVHDAVKRLVGTPAMDNVLNFYAKTHIHSDMERYVINEVERYKREHHAR